MATNNKYSTENVSLYSDYKEATGKNAVWKGKLTQGFKAWKKELKNKPAEVEIKIDETEEMAEAIQDVKEAEKIQKTEMEEIADNGMDDIFDLADFEEESEPEVEIPIPEDKAEEEWDVEIDEFPKFPDDEDETKEEKPKTPKKAKKSNVRAENKVKIINHVKANKGKFFSHRDFVDVTGQNGRQVRPLLVALYKNNELDKKTEHKRNWYKLKSN